MDIYLNKSYNMAGQSFDLTDDKNILSINSPRNSLSGPYVVVYKNIPERWAIVAAEWDNEPRLAIRWFWGNGGNPFSSGNPTWLIIPNSLTNSILNGLPLDFIFLKRVENFLIGEIRGTEL